MSAESATNYECPLSSHEELYDHTVCDLDLNLTVYDGDRDVVFDLLQDDTLRGIVNTVNEEGKNYRARKELLKSSLRLTPNMAPGVFKIAERCTKVLGLKQEIEFYIYQDQMFNAACYPPSDDKIFIMVTSGLFEKFTEAELQFVIGHEIGHFLFRHNNIPVEMILERGQGHLAPLQAMKLYSWKRNAEITADRVGLLCCQDFDAVGKAFFKLSSGVTVDQISFQLKEYIDQFKELQEEIGDDNVDPRDWYSTHPFSPLRLKALEFFRQSDTYHKLINQSGGKIGEQEMEDSIKRFMAVMEPSCLEDNSETGLNVQKFIFLGGFIIAIANDVIEDSEIESLKTLVTPEVYEEMLPQMEGKSMDEMVEMIMPIAEKLCISLPLVSRLNMIEQLSIITYADGSIDDSEVNVLYNLCNILEINPEFADQVLHNATQPMD